MKECLYCISEDGTPTNDDRKKFFVDWHSKSKMQVDSTDLLNIGGYINAKDNVHDFSNLDLGLYFVDAYLDTIKIPIHYCPMCGRKLD